MQFAYISSFTAYLILLPSSSSGGPKDPCKISSFPCFFKVFLGGQHFCKILQETIYLTLF